MPVLGVRRGRSSCSSQLQPLGAALGEQGAKPELKSFCVLGVALRGSTALIDHAAYLFTALTRWLWSSTSRDREALYPGLHQPLMQYVGYGVPRTPQGVEKPSLSAEGISCDASERYTTRVDWEPAGAGRPPAPLASDPSRRR